MEKSISYRVALIKISALMVASEIPIGPFLLKLESSLRYPILVGLHRFFNWPSRVLCVIVCSFLTLTLLWVLCFMSSLQANGSARVRIGTTEVIASVKVLFCLAKHTLLPSYFKISFIEFFFPHHFKFQILCFSVYVQAELGRPSALHPDKGKVAIFVDCSPVAEPTFEVICFLTSLSS